jgi:cation diffusion facilitator CzcD-associated flavoprotein CzcO
MEGPATGACSEQDSAEYFDVVVVGAGISGIGAACHMLRQCPATSFAVLEAMDSFGGTWHIHNYPGTRSDSDLFTFGYRFKPWLGLPIAPRQEILSYLGQVIEDHGLAKHIRYSHNVVSASWSSEEKLWTIKASDSSTGSSVSKVFKTNFMWMCQGYYDHAEGFTPKWEGMSAFKGGIVHPQKWPKDLDYKNKNVVIIGSGATAATLVPAMAADCAHVTLLQRSPTYFIPVRNVNELAVTLNELDVDPMWSHEIVRRKVLSDYSKLLQRVQAEPETVKAELIQNVRDKLPPDFDVETHFVPRYRPWQQRLALIPEGDLFKSISTGKTSVVTDEIETFLENGLRLKSGATLDDVDLVITATGFNLAVLGGAQFFVDNKPVDFGNTVTYRGMMFTGIPNLVWIFGYIRASWTLRVELVADFVCRLLNHMKETKARQVEVTMAAEDNDMPRRPWISADNFNPSYVTRGMHLLPKGIDRTDWQHGHDYYADKVELPAIDIKAPLFCYKQ